MTSDPNGHVPPGWSVARLDECVDVLDKARRPVNATERAKRRGSIPYYGATGQVGWIDKPLFDEELILLGEDGAPFLDKSKPIAYVIDGPSWVNNHAHVLRARPTVTSNRYLKYFLDSFDFSDRVGGSTRDKLTQRDMNSIPVLLAPAEHQQQIVRTLDEIDAHRTSIAARLAAARAIVDRLRTAVLAAACSGRLTADWRGADADAGGDGATNTLDGAIDLLLSGLPASYNVSTVGAVSERLEYGTSKKADTEGEVPVLRMGNIRDGRIDTTDLKYLALNGEVERLLLDDGDLLFNRTNSPDLVGKTAVFHGYESATFASYLIRVRFQKELIEPDFVGMWLNSAWGRMWARQVKTDGVSQSNINGTKLAAMPLPLPPLAEQHEIVRRATGALEVADRLKSAIAATTEALDRAMKGAAAKAFRGELVTE